MFAIATGDGQSIAEGADALLGEGSGAVRFAWCFDHGRLHRDPGWCTASWVPLAGATEDEAMADKRRRFGAAEFTHSYLANSNNALH